MIAPKRRWTDAMASTYRSLERQNRQLRERVRQLEAAGCPHVVTSDEGTSYCDLGADRIEKLEKTLRYIARPTMGLPSGEDPYEFALRGAEEHMVRGALAGCIQLAKQALAKEERCAATITQHLMVMRNEETGPHVWTREHRCELPEHHPNDHLVTTVDTAGTVHSHQWSRSERDL